MSFCGATEHPSPSTSQYIVKKTIYIALLLVVSHKISDVLTLNLHGIIDGYSQLDIITKMKQCSKNTMLQTMQTRSRLMAQGQYSQP